MNTVKIHKTAGSCLFIGGIIKLESKQPLKFLKPLYNNTSLKETGGVKPPLTCCSYKTTAPEKETVV